MILVKMRDGTEREYESCIATNGNPVYRWSPLEATMVGKPHLTGKTCLFAWNGSPADSSDNIVETLYDDDWAEAVYDGRTFMADAA